MIHTIEMVRLLSHKEFQTLKEKLYSMGLQIMKHRQVHEVLAYADSGIRINLVNHRYTPHICFVINPTAVLEHGNVTDLFGNKDDFDEVIKIFDKQIGSLLGEDFSFEKLKLNRVDLCKDMQLGSPDEVSEYIHLMYKSNSKKGYKIKGRKVKDYDQGIGFLCENPSSGVGVSIYDKRAQLRNIGKPEQSDIVGSRLRIELQLRSAKAIYKFKYCKTNGEQIKFLLDESQFYFHEFLPDILLDADYYKLSMAIDIVRAQENGKIRDRMVRLLKLSSKRHGIRAGVKALKREQLEVTDEYIRKMKRHFLDLNVNIVTLGKRSNIDYLPSLLRQI